MKLTVFDGDATGAQDLHFILKNLTSLGLFALNHKSGELAFAREALDEDIGSHHLEIEVSIFSLFLQSQTEVKVLYCFRRETVGFLHVHQ